MIALDASGAGKRTKFSAGRGTELPILFHNVARPPELNVPMWVTSPFSSPSGIDILSSVFISQKRSFLRDERMRFYLSEG
jgi:hypothetical protein